MPCSIRRVRRPTFALAAAFAAILVACADAPHAPAIPGAPRASAALADYFIVSNTNDHGIGSLRWVLSYADSGQVVRFEPALAGRTIVLDSAVKMYLSDITIEGPRAGGITISGGGKTRVFETWGRGPYRFRDLSIVDGRAGGGPAIFGGNDVTVENAAIHGHHAVGGASAISVGKLTLVNSTVSGNRSDSAAAAAVDARQKVELINSTIAHNRSVGVDGTTLLVLRNAIISNNDGRNCDVGPSAFSRVGISLSDDDTCGGPADMLIADPRLGPLADNGGPTRTHALLVGSPAINAGTSCTVPFDQRHAARDAACDLGAYEFADFTTAAVTIDPGSSVSAANGWAVLSGTVRCSRAERFALAVQLTQQRRSGRTATTVEASAVVPVECSPTPRLWTASMVPASGAFESGEGAATAATVDAEPWITPASTTASVKMTRMRK